MKKASLRYVINNPSDTKKIILTTGSLSYIDYLTSLFNCSDEFVSDYIDKHKPYDFKFQNTLSKGSLELIYTIDVEKKINIPILYGNSDEIVLKDDFINGKISEIEKARKLLFNSKNQWFARNVLLNDYIKDLFSYIMELSYNEYLLSQKHGLDVASYNGKHYISFSELIKYRSKNNKLGDLRNLYEEMLELWKNQFANIDYDDLYYYSRQLLLLIKQYDILKNKNSSICNLYITSKCCDIIQQQCICNHKFGRGMRKVFNKFNAKVEVA